MSDKLNKASEPDVKVAGSQKSEVARRLGRLRKAAGYSVRGLAEAIGWSESTYSSYESRRYKKPYMPLELIDAILPVLTRRGVDEKEVRMLGGNLLVSTARLEAGAQKRFKVLGEGGQAVRVLYDASQDLVVLQLIATSGQVLEVDMDRSAGASLREQLAKSRL